MSQVSNNFKIETKDDDDMSATQMEEEGMLPPPLISS
jgi:hypothetical protein